MSDNTVKLHVSELRVGMYVSKLDREWLDTPFLMQGFYIESRDDVDTVCQYCEHVWVDVTRKAKGTETSSNPPSAFTGTNPPNEQNVQDFDEKFLGNLLRRRFSQNVCSQSFHDLI